MRVFGTKWTRGFDEVLADRLVLLLAQRDVPARQTVFDLSVGARVLLEDRDLDAARGERAGDFRAGDGAADHRDAMRGLRLHGAGA